MSLIEQIGLLATRIATEFKSIRNILNLPDTTFANQVGVIQKNGVPFLHNFNYGPNGSVTTEGNNLFIGKNAGNFTIGATAIDSQMGSYNIALGTNSLHQATKSMFNIAIGMGTLGSATESHYSVAIGFEALKSATTGSGNYAIGYQSMYNLTTGFYNAAYGTFSLYSNVTAEENVSLGYKSLYNNTGGFNTAVGARASYYQTTGTHNVAVGNQAAYYLSTGLRNVAIGATAGNKTSTGSNASIINDSIFIGYDSRPLGNSQTNQIVIGNGAIGNGSNTVQIGDTSITKVYTSGKIAHSAATLDSESATLGQVKTEINTNAPKVVTGITVSTSGWTLVSGFYEKSISDASITANSIVDVVIDKADTLTQLAAVFAGRTDSSAGEVKIYAVNVPEADMGASLIIREKSV